MLRREYRISAHEAEHVLPEWERAMLVRVYVSQFEGSSEKSGDPFAQVPDDLKGLPG